MPEVDYALLCDYVRAEGGVAHVVAAGIDTIYATQVPAGQNLGILYRVTFVRAECDRPHRIEVFFQDEDGARLSAINSSLVPTWNEDLPPHWPVGLLAGINMGVPLPRYGMYSFEILVDDAHKKTISLRVVPARSVDAPSAG